MERPEELKTRGSYAPLWGGVIGGVMGGVVAGLIAGAFVANAIQPLALQMLIPFPPGADPDYLCFCKVDANGDKPNDFLFSIPRGNSCPHDNPCNNINCEIHRCNPD